MERTSRAGITVGTDQKFVIGLHTKPVQEWCADCTQPAHTVKPEEAVDSTGLRVGYRPVEACRLHQTETSEGFLLECLNSLSLTAGNPVIRRQPTVVVAEPREFFDPEDPEEVIVTALSTEAQSAQEASHGVSRMDNVGLRASELKKGWVLTAISFEKLLASLDPDRDRAGQKYEAIRCKLLKFFEYRGCISPEDQTDETINRVAKRINEGREIWAAAPVNYFYGVARYVLMEYWHSPERENSPLEWISTMGRADAFAPAFDSRQQHQTDEAAHQALEHCMQALAAGDREMLLQYYQGEKSEKIRNRQGLAMRLAIPVNALRIRVHRIRKRIEADVIEYIQQHHD